MIVRWVLAISLAMQPCLLSQPSFAAAKLNSFTTESRRAGLLGAAAAGLNSYENFGKLVDSLTRAADRAYLRANFSALMKLPVRARILAPDGIELSVGVEKLTVFTKDLTRGQFRILAKEFSFKPGESASDAVKRLRGLNSAGGIFLPRAEAIGVVAGLVLGWITMSTVVAVGCVMMEATDRATCLKTALVAPPVIVAAAAYMAGALTLASLGLIDPNGKPAYFDVKEIECSPNLDKPLRATLTSAEKIPSVAEIHFKASGGPDFLEIKYEGEVAQKVFLTESYGVDEKRSSELIKEGAVLELAKMRARASQVLAKACEGNDSREALALHLKWKAASAGVPDYKPTPPASAAGKTAQ